MVTFPLFYLLFCCLYIFSAGSSTEENEGGTEHGWGYTPQNGPSTWGGTCKTGKKQSPINIQQGSVLPKYFPSFTFDENYSSKHMFYAKNNGHTIYAALTDDFNEPVFFGGGHKDKFIFEQLHLHWESEHEFDGKRADLEMHLVHYNSKYKNFHEAVTKPDGVAVLAVIFDESNKTKNVLEDFFAYILDSSSLGEHPHDTASSDNSLLELKKEQNSGSFALRDLLPEDVSRFYRYDGSLTTPGCGEVVEWTVFINRLPVSREVLDALRTLKDHDGNPLTENFRPPQSLNGRQVFIRMQSDGGSDLKNEQLTDSGSYGKSLLSPINLLGCCVIVFFPIELI